MEPQAISSQSTAPWTSSSSPPDQRNFRMTSRTEDPSPYPIPGLTADALHMRVKEGSKIRNLLRFATARMQMEGEGRDGPPPRQVIFTGSGRGVTKTITCVEIFKRKVGGLHQVSKLYTKTVSEMWDSVQQGEPGKTVHRTVPAISILLSKDPLDPCEPGYQPPLTISSYRWDRESSGTLERLPCPPSSQSVVCEAKRARLDHCSTLPSSSSV